MNTPESDSVQRPALTQEARESHRYVVFCFLLLIVALQIAAGPIVRLPDWHVSPDQPALLEARAWLDGRTDVGRRSWDTALHEGRYFNIYPPCFTLISVVALSLGRLAGAPPDTFYPFWYLLVAALPLPLVGFWAFQQVMRRAAWSAVFTAGWLLATPMLPMIRDCRDGSINSLNHVLSNIGLMLMAGDLLGRRRLWPAAIGLIIAAWSRQLTLAYGVAAVWIAWRAGVPRGRRTAIAVGALLMAAGGLMTLNWMRFGDPLETGYLKIYSEGRERGWYGQRAHEHGVFSPHFVAENAWYMNFSPPLFRLSPAFVQAANHSNGVGIWMTCPLLLLAFWHVRRWWTDSAARPMMLASAAVIAALLTYHNTGAVQVGFFRFALDFVPIWLMVIAPHALGPRGAYVTMGCLAWSAWYFYMIC